MTRRSCAQNDEVAQLQEYRYANHYSGDSGINTKRVPSRTSSRSG